MVGCIDSVADIADMGRDLRAWNDAAGHMEFYHRAAVLREACAGASTTAHGGSYERGWGTVGAHGVVAVFGSAAVRVFLG